MQTLHSPPPTLLGPYRLIPLGKGKFTIVDAHNFEDLNKYTWRLRKSHSLSYVARKVNRYGKQKTIFMHRQIMRPTKDQQTHHRNGNTKDNTEQNLQNVTRLQHSHIQQQQRITATK